MELYLLLRKFAEENKVAPAPSLQFPELGNSLSLFHTCLVESGMDQEEVSGKPRVIALPSAIDLNHLSRFIVGFLPFNAVSTKEEMNNVLFDLYLFIKWLEKNDISHGLESIDYQQVVKKLSSAQERCLQLSHFLDDETGKVLEENSKIVETINDFFSVIKIEGDFIFLRGQHRSDPIRLRLPERILNLVRLEDTLDLVVGDTADRWVLLEAGQVYPEYNALESNS